MTRTALIAGAGIGGLTAGIALRLAGWHVCVLERTPQLQEVGAGVQIGPNGMRILQALDVLPLLERQMFEPEALEMRIGLSGRRVFHLPLAEAAKARWGAPYAHVHRADLQTALAARLEALQPGAVRTGTAVTGFKQGEGQVHVLTSNGTLDGEMLIGADGVHSNLRNQLFGADTAQFTGNVAWRALVPVDALQTPPPPTACIWAGPGKHAVTTRVSGGRIVNFVGVVEQSDWQHEGWSLPGERAEVLDAFAGWAPDVIDVISNAPQFNRWALLSRAPLPRWGDGRVALLGDAAHPMLPSLAQGAVQAMEDAVALAHAAPADVVDVPDALDAYHTMRKARATRVQAQSARQVKLYHHRSRLRQIASYGPIFAVGRYAPWLMRQRLDWLLGHNPMGDPMGDAMGDGPRT